METQTNETAIAVDQKPIVGWNIPSGKYNEQRWLAAHNSWNTYLKPWNNQCLTITELLNFGVRGFALDIYGDDEISLHLQHGHGNIATSVKWSIVRDEFKAWLAANPTEIVSLFFESYLTGPKPGHNVFTPLLGLHDSLCDIPCYVAGKERQQGKLRDKTLNELVADNLRLFAFLEKEPDEGVQPMFPVMTDNFAENVYEGALTISGWCELRSGSSYSNPYRFMNHFAKDPTYSSTNGPLIVKHAGDFLFNFGGHYPNFVSLDKVNCSPDDDGSQAAIRELLTKEDMAAVTPFAWNQSNGFEDVVVQLGEVPITGFAVNMTPDEGIINITALRGTTNPGPDVTGVQLVNVPGQGIVNMRYKVGGGDWGPWVTPYKHIDHPAPNLATHLVPAGQAMLGICCRTASGYGVVDFATASR